MMRAARSRYSSIFTRGGGSGFDGCGVGVGVAMGAGICRTGVGAGRAGVRDGRAGRLWAGACTMTKAVTSASRKMRRKAVRCLLLSGVERTSLPSTTNLDTSDSKRLMVASPPSAPGIVSLLKCLVELRSGRGGAKITHGAEF